MQTPLEIMAKRLPQMYFKIEEGISENIDFKKAVLKAKDLPAGLSIYDNFKGSSEDKLFKGKTPAGEAEILYLANRKDFENFYICAANWNEPKEVPKTMGACTLIGLNDISKIRKHIDDYIKAGGQYPTSEFMDFTAKPENYKFTLLVLSKGNYSNVQAKDTNYSEEQWLDISYKIRLYHELCHFMVRKLYKEQNAIWDEILADCMGLIFATGEYNTKLAKLFLGIEDKTYTKGRLENYCKADEINEKAIYAAECIKKLKKIIDENKNIEDNYKLILKAQENFNIKE